MLGKLLRYETRATARTFIPIYMALLVVSTINRVFRVNNIDIGFNLSALIIVGLFISLGVLTLIMVIQRFNKNLLSDEGYLMFTLPVKISDLVLSKVLISFLWTIVSSIIGVIAILILLGDATFFEQVGTLLTVDNWNLFLQGIRDGFGGNPIILIIELIIIGICMYSSTILTIYLSISVGQLPLLNKHRVLFSFIAYFLFNTVGQWVLIMIDKLYNSLNIDLSSTVELSIATLFCVGLNIALFYAINFILVKHLNLE